METPKKKGVFSVFTLHREEVRRFAFSFSYGKNQPGTPHHQAGGGKNCTEKGNFPKTAHMTTDGWRGEGERRRKSCNTSSYSE